MTNCVIGKRARATIISIASISALLFAAPSLATSVGYSIEDLKPSSSGGWNPHLLQPVNAANHRNLFDGRWFKPESMDSVTARLKEILNSIGRGNGLDDHEPLGRHSASFWRNGIDRDMIKTFALGLRFDRARHEFFATHGTELSPDQPMFGDDPFTLATTTVPVPPAALLFGSALILLGRKKNANSR